MIIYIMEYSSPSESEEPTFRKVDVIDAYISLIWTERFSRCGDFELYLPATTENINKLSLDRMLYRPDTKRIMFIEKIDLQTDLENGNKLIVSGRSLESILQRRIVWGRVGLGGTPEHILYTIIKNQCINNTTTTSRNFTFLVLADEKYTDWDKCTKQYTGDNLYDIAVDICESNSVGMKMDFYTNDDGDKKVKFSLYSGVDHTVPLDSKTIENYQDNKVTFSPTFNNILNADYTEDKTNFGTHFYIMGEGEGANRLNAQYFSKEYQSVSGISRYEIFIDSRDTDNTQESGTGTTALYEKAKEKSTEYLLINDFTATIINTSQYKYKVDFDIGDIVQLADAYGHNAPARITEVIENWDANNGYTIELTLENIN